MVSEVWSWDYLCQQHLETYEKYKSWGPAQSYESETL